MARSLLLLFCLYSICVLSAPDAASTSDTGDTCDADPVETSSSTTSSPPTITTAPPMPSCSLQNEDPDQGINNQGCICGSKTLPLLTVASPTDDAQSCAYTAWPSSSVPNPITIESQVWTTNCQACKLVGGIADTPSCTSIAGCQPTAAPTPTPSTAAPNPTQPATGPTPTLAINLSNNTVSVGDENSKNNGTDLRNTMHKVLQALCLQPAGSCTSTHDAEIDGIESLSPDDQPDDGHLNFTITDSSYNSPKERDQMLAAAVLAWQQAVANTCKEVPYGGIPSASTTCNTGPVKKRSEGSTDGKLEDRSPIKKDPCTYNADLCVGPDHISIMLGNATDPYANHLNIDVSWTLDKKPVNPWAVFVCELVIDLMTEAVIALAPVLMEEDIFAGLDLAAKCADQMG